MVPADWTDEQFQEEIRQVFATVLQERLNSTTTTRGENRSHSLLCRQSQNVARHAKYKVTETGRSYKKEAFVGLLNSCCGDTVKGLKLTWEELVMIFIH